MKGKNALLNVHIDELGLDEMRSHLVDFAKSTLEPREQIIFNEIILPILLTNNSEIRDLLRKLFSLEFDEAVEALLTGYLVKYREGDSDIEEFTDHFANALNIFKKVSEQDEIMYLNLLNRLINNDPKLEYKLTQLFNRASNSRLNEKKDMELLEASIIEAPMFPNNLKGSAEYYLHVFRREIGITAFDFIIMFIAASLYNGSQIAEDLKIAFSYAYLVLGALTIFNILLKTREADMHEIWRKKDILRSLIRRTLLELHNKKSVQGYDIDPGVLESNEGIDFDLNEGRIFLNRKNLEG